MSWFVLGLWSTVVGHWFFVSASKRGSLGSVGFEGRVSGLGLSMPSEMGLGESSVEERLSIDLMSHWVIYAAVVRLTMKLIRHMLKGNIETWPSKIERC